MAFRNSAVKKYNKYLSQVKEGQGVRVVSGTRRLSACVAACAASVPRRAICDNKQQQIELDPVFTFWCYLAVSIDHQPMLVHFWTTICAAVDWWRFFKLAASSMPTLTLSYLDLAGSLPFQLAKGRTPPKRRRE